MIKAAFLLPIGVSAFSGVHAPVHGCVRLPDDVARLVDAEAPSMPTPDACEPRVQTTDLFQISHRSMPRSGKGSAIIRDNAMQQMFRNMFPEGGCEPWFPERHPECVKGVNYWCIGNHANAKVVLRANECSADFKLMANFYDPSMGANPNEYPYRMNCHKSNLRVVGGNAVCGGEVHVRDQTCEIITKRSSGLCNFECNWDKNIPSVTVRDGCRATFRVGAYKRSNMRTNKPQSIVCNSWEQIPRNADNYIKFDWKEELISVAVANDYVLDFSQESIQTCVACSVSTTNGDCINGINYFCMPPGGAGYHVASDDKISVGEERFPNHSHIVTAGKCTGNFILRGIDNKNHQKRFGCGEHWRESEENNHKIEVCSGFTIPGKGLSFKKTRDRR